MKQTKFAEFQLLEWRVNLPSLLKEILDGYPHGGGIFVAPFNILFGILDEVATRASELNDPILNALMCRLALYAISDPYDKENFNKELLNKVLNSEEYLNYKKSKK